MGTNTGVVTCGSNSYTVTPTVATTALKAVLPAVAVAGTPACPAG